MESIIQQITIEMIEEVLKVLREVGIAHIGDTIGRVQKVSNEATLKIISATISEGDLALVNAKQERSKHGLTIRERDVARTVTTELGELTYKRTYFKCTDGGYCCPVDSIIGIEPYERITKELCASMVQRAANTSMEKAAMGIVSRQTVNNRVMALKQVAVSAKKEEHTPEELHVFADEDHVHLRPKKSEMVPLVTVTEGIDNTNKRHRTINAVHFEGYGMDNRSFFEGISSFLNERYDMQSVKRVYLHSDGGGWIDAAEEWFPNVERAMDGYHLQKRLKRISRLNGAAAYMANIYKAIRGNDFERFALYCSRIEEKQNEQGRKVLREEQLFIQRNWNSIVLRMKDEICGSCTEAMVSHVLSERLSRNPMGWSKDGLRQMSMLRVYVQNGGVVTANDIRVSRSKAERNFDSKALHYGLERYHAYADKQIKEFLNKRFDWSIFDNYQYRNGKLDGTGMLLKAYGRDHGVLDA